MNDMEIRRLYNEDLKQQIIDLMRESNEPLSALEIAQELDISTQKTCALMKQLHADGQIATRYEKAMRKFAMQNETQSNFTFDYEVTDGDEIDFEFTHTPKIRQLANKILAIFYTIEMLLDEIEL